MKTSQEIEVEAQRLMVLGRQYWEMSRGRDAERGASPAITWQGSASRVLFRFPDSTVTFHLGAGSDPAATETRRWVRRIELELNRARPEYTLIEEEYEAEPFEGIERLNGPIPVMESDSVIDVLTEGYRITEEERLATLLDRYAERSDDRDGTDPSDARTVAEVEGILETNLLPHASRIRTKAEIAEFLAGRLEPSVFIAHVLERHCARDGGREQLTEQHEIKLTIDEP